jgi:signal transduction histidine kinase
VRDDGPGLSPEDEAHLFERFYRGAAARDYKVPGTGVGLAFCKVVVESLGGRISVENVPATEGSGAAFTVWLKPAD